MLGDGCGEAGDQPLVLIVGDLLRAEAVAAGRKRAELFFGHLTRICRMEKNVTR